MNLHHVLYGLSLMRRGDTSGGGGSSGNGLEVFEGMEKATLDDAERRTWDAAIDVYVANVAEKNVTFDDELAGINQRLSAAQNATDLGTSGIAPALSRALASAMPVYRKHWWTDDDRRNQEWIATSRRYVDQHGAALASELARLYQSQWPKEPLLVDVTRYANWAGAYTTMGPDHLTISGPAPQNQCPMCLEILVHEASHAIIRPLRDKVDRELARQNKSSRDLWHGILFYSTGHLVQRRIPGHVPFAIKYGLYSRNWKAFGPVLEKAWTPYLERRTSLDVALQDVVSELPSP